MDKVSRPLQLGLQENWKQFSLLVIVNAFVGGMVGMERTIIPALAEQEFGLASKTAVLSFITAFGITKAIANYYTGRLANRFGRRKLLLFGWIVAIPVPIILILAPDWSWVIVANMLLGISQGFAWSSTVVMKMDLVGEKDRGFAMGLNEFAGYLAVGITAFITGYIAQVYGITPYPFYIGIALVILGFLITLLWIKDTQSFVQHENITTSAPTLNNVFLETTFTHKTLSSVNQAGMINNLNDGMIWGLLPVILATQHFNYEQIGIITSIYPAVWGIAQLFTGKMADHFSKKGMLFWGMLSQGIAIIALPFTQHYAALISVAALLGLGTALVYPTFLATIAHVTTPAQRAESVGTFRLWRDLGYAFGAVFSGIIADALGVEYAIYFVGLLTIISAVIIKVRMPREQHVYQECIARPTVQAMQESGTPIIIIDVRSKEEYDASHLTQAIHIPLPELHRAMHSFQRHITYVIVCGKGGGRSQQGAHLLRNHGLHAYWLCGGTTQ